MMKTEIKKVELGLGGFGIDVWSGTDENPHHWEHHHFSGVSHGGVPSQWQGEITAVSISGHRAKAPEETMQLRAARDFMTTN